MIITIIVFIALYVLGGLTYMRLGKKAGVEWAWVSWLPYGMPFVTAKALNWDKWALFPILAIAAMVVGIIPFLGYLYFLFVAIFLIIQLAQFLIGYGRSPWLLLWNLIPWVGSIVFFIIMLQTAWSNKYAFNFSVAGNRTWYGSRVTTNSTNVMD